MIARVLALILLLPLLLFPVLIPPTSTGAAPARSHPATHCHTHRNRNHHVTSVVWSTGDPTAISAMRYRDLSVRRSLFPGVRTVERGATRTSRKNVVTSCVVLADGDVRVSTSRGVRLRYHQPAVVEPPPPPDPVPTTAAPALWGTWRGPITLYSTVDSTWQVEAAVAAWNTALPADRQITITTTPCDGHVTLGCIAVHNHDFSPTPDYNGAAWVNYAEGVVSNCYIGLNGLINVAQRPTTSAHEVGHCLGLPHWDGKWSVMRPFADPTDKVTKWDLEWLSAGYATASNPPV